jgi:hypothetical protein
MELTFIFDVLSVTLYIGIMMMMIDGCRLSMDDDDDDLCIMMVMKKQ